MAVLTVAAGGLVADGPVAAQAAPTTATAIVPGHTTPPPGGTVSIGQGVDALGDNAQLGETLGAGVRGVWSGAAPVCPSTSGDFVGAVAVTRTSVVTLDEEYQCAFVSSYAVGTGALQWRRPYHFARYLQAVGGVVYVVHDDAADTGQFDLDALSAGNGALRYTVPVSADASQQYVFSVGSGLVADDIWVADAATGAQKFSLDLGTTTATGGTTDIRGGELLYDGGSVNAYSTTNGHLLWTHPNTAYPGPGGGFPVLHGGRLYYPGPYGTLVLNATTGRQTALLPSTWSDLAVDGSVGFFTTSTEQDSVAGTISARRLSDGATLWRTTLPATGGHTSEASSPVVANGLVWIDTFYDSATPGRLLALDEVTGAIRTDLPLACAPGGSPTVAQHHVVVPTQCGVQTFG